MYSQKKIIESTIYAYRDWSSQPDRELILSNSMRGRLSLFLKLESPDPSMKVGVLESWRIWIGS